MVEFIHKMFEPCALRHGNFWGSWLGKTAHHPVLARMGCNTGLTEGFRYEKIHFFKQKITLKIHTNPDGGAHGLCDDVRVVLV